MTAPDSALEIEVISACVTALSRLDDVTLARVLAYLRSRFAPSIMPKETP